MKVPAFAYSKTGDVMKNLIRTLLFLLLLFCLLFFGSLNVQMSVDALRIWFEKLVPSMFGVMVLIKVMFALGILTSFAKVFGNLFGNLFAIEAENFSYVFAMIFLGFPAGAAMINEEVACHHLREQEGRRLIYTCSFATPGFILLTCGSVLFHSTIIGLKLFLIQLCSGMCLLLLTRQNPIKGRHIDRIPPSFTKALTTAMAESGKTLYMIGGYLMLCMSIFAILFQFFPIQIQLFLRIISEFSSGAILISDLSLPISMQCVLLSALLSFGGLCVHMQVMSMCEATSLVYPTYCFYRILQAVLSTIFAFFIFMPF